MNSLKNRVQLIGYLGAKVAYLLFICAYITSCIWHVLKNIIPKMELNIKVFKTCYLICKKTSELYGFRPLFFI